MDRRKKKFLEETSFSPTPWNLEKLWLSVQQRKHLGIDNKESVWKSRRDPSPPSILLHLIFPFWRLLKMCYSYRSDVFREKSVKLWSFTNERALLKAIPFWHKTCLNSIGVCLKIMKISSSASESDDDSVTTLRCVSHWLTCHNCFPKL